MLNLKLAKADNTRPTSLTRLQLSRVASYRQIIVYYGLILACSGSFTKQDLLRAKEKPSD